MHFLGIQDYLSRIATFRIGLSARPRHSSKERVHGCVPPVGCVCIVFSTRNSLRCCARCGDRRFCPAQRGGRIPGWWIQWRWLSRWRQWGVETGPSAAEEQLWPNRPHPPNGARSKQTPPKRVPQPRSAPHPVLPHPVSPHPSPNPSNSITTPRPRTARSEPVQIQRPWGAAG